MCLLLSLHIPHWADLCVQTSLSWSSQRADLTELIFSACVPHWADLSVWTSLSWSLLVDLTAWPDPLCLWTSLIWSYVVPHLTGPRCCTSGSVCASCSHISLRCEGGSWATLPRSFRRWGSCRGLTAAACLGCSGTCPNCCHKRQKRR